MSRIKKTYKIFLMWFFMSGLFSFQALMGAPNGKIQFMTTPDGAQIRYVYYEAPQPCHKTIILLQGRSSFMEKHQELIQDFLERGFDVWAFDWRGQGGSTRIVNHPQKNHIDDYELYLNDLDQLMREQIQPHHQKGPLILFGSSMGGHLALRYVMDYPGRVQGAILESPMFHVPTERFSLFVARPLVRLLCFLGFSQAYVFGWGDFDPRAQAFEGNQMTSDRARFQRQMDICLQYPSLTASGPTFGWVKATFDSIDKLMNPRKLKAIEVPILIVNAGLDSIVNTEFDQKIARLMPKAILKTYPDAHHHVMQETDVIRNRFWSDMESFFKAYSS